MFYLGYSLSNIDCEIESQIAVGNFSKEVREESGYVGVSAEKQACS